MRLDRHEQANSRFSEFFEPLKKARFRPTVCESPRNFERIFKNLIVGI
jgi:hypothetical protein